MEPCSSAGLDYQKTTVKQKVGSTQILHVIIQYCLEMEVPGTFPRARQDVALTAMPLVHDTRCVAHPEKAVAIVGEVFTDGANYLFCFSLYLSVSLPPSLFLGPKGGLLAFTVSAVALGNALSSIIRRLLSLYFDFRL